MKTIKKVHAWKNPEFRQTLSGEEQAELNHPAGLQALEDSVLTSITGGCGPNPPPGCGGGGGGGGFPGATTFLMSCVPPGSGCP